MTDSVQTQAAEHIRTIQRSSRRAGGGTPATTSVPCCIAVDFDGCLCDDAYPEIGKAHGSVIDALLQRQQDGCEIILWTCREGWLLAEAIGWCKAHGLFFTAVNTNVQSRISKYGNDCRKIGADEYWDDRAVVIKNGRFVRNY